MGAFEKIASMSAGITSSKCLYPLHHLVPILFQEVGSAPTAFPNARMAPILTDPGMLYPSAFRAPRSSHNRYQQEGDSGCTTTLDSSCGTPPDLGISQRI